MGWRTKCGVGTRHVEENNSDVVSGPSKRWRYGSGSLRLCMRTAPRGPKEGCYSGVVGYVIWWVYIVQD